ncbi:DUF4271 domain-containing protein [Flammeovirgaceae bacterium SG7u.132]|nr:DUF4271 domain-containing protein [Flammeovirgaceae bacterium SG7u.132]
MLCLFVVGKAKANQSVIEDLSEDWSVYDVRLEGFVPYLSDIHRNVKSIYMPLSLDQYRGNLLSISSIDGAHLFFNNKLVQLMEGDDFTYYSVDSLLSAQNQGFIQVAIYSPTSFDNIPALRVVSEKSNASVVSIDRAVFTPNKIQSDYNKEFVVIFSLGILFVFSVVLQKKNPFGGLIEIGAILAKMLKSKSMPEKYSTRYVLYFLFFFSLSFSFLLVFLRESSDLFRESSLVLSNYLGGTLFLVSTQLFILIFVLMLLKLLIIRVLSSLYGFAGLADIHTFEYISFTHFFTTIFLLGGVMLNLLPVDIPMEVAVALLFVVVFFKSLFIVMRINRLLTYKKVYLFSYFCITEFIPILFALKFFINI